MDKTTLSSTLLHVSKSRARASHPLGVLSFVDHSRGFVVISFLIFSPSFSALWRTLRTVVLSVCVCRNFPLAHFQVREARVYDFLRFFACFLSLSDIIEARRDLPERDLAESAAPLLEFSPRRDGLRLSERTSLA
ncbi:hypothetical protein DEO72_LG5g1792 [Vigna unguiculata]|uniref:Uncharacterized protein n=1 Tax=Vigna unguiculata TaxID=3917 RepID=A0A4D6M0I0_VIGUN|nr:hypothetical protein DEO72_LG5g1792 [Vigna unguiculata]